MARARNPNRDEAKKIWLESGGTISTKELAARTGLTESRIRKIKSLDKWQEELDAKKQGGQPGNKNAAGHGAPKGNNNAETHGAYSRVHLENLTPEQREYIENLTLDAKANMLRELQLLFAKERDLASKINFYENAKTGELFVDRIIEMFVPKSDRNSGKNSGGKSENEKIENLKIVMKTEIKSSSFERILKLETEYNKNHGRILKLLDTIRAHDLDTQRLDLDERKHTIAKQRLTGEYIIDPDTGELDDSADAVSAGDAPDTAAADGADGV